MSVRLPRLLDSSLNEIERIEPETLSVNLTATCNNNATMRLAIGSSQIAMHSWVELFTCRGSAGIFRVSGIDNDYTSGIQTVDLSHGFCVLQDAFMDGDTQKKTYKQWFDAIVAAQTQKVGNTKYWSTNFTSDEIDILSAYNSILKPGGDDLFTILHKVIADLSWLQCRLTYDQTSFPWKIEVGFYDLLSIGAEGRLSRNVSSARVSYNDSNLCTRVYSSKLSGGYLDSSNVSKYGIIARSISINDDYTSSEAQRIAQQYLAEHDEPFISVEVSGDDLYTLTGEYVDNITIGRMLQLTLPTYGTTVRQLITGISYPNAIDEPERVTVTLANKIPDLSSGTRSLY